MAGTTTLSPCCTSTPPLRLTQQHHHHHLHLSHSQPPNLSFPHQPIYFHPLTTPQRTPTAISCRAKWDDSAGEEFEGIGNFFDDNEMVEDSDDEDDTESSIDLLLRFLQSMFRKLSKRAKKASRSLLPTVIPPQLVSFAVDGTLLLAALSVAKALLEVVCSLGSTVFAAIVFLRVTWSAISYFQSSGNTFNQGGSSFGTI